MKLADELFYKFKIENGLYERDLCYWLNHDEEVQQKMNEQVSKLREIIGWL